MTQKYIIFDCDGVLVDSEIIACRLEAQALTEAGYPISTEDNIRQFAGKSQQSIMNIVETALGKPLPTDFDDKLNQKILAALSQELQPIAGIKDVLEKLNHQGIEFCIASSGSMEKILNSLNVTGLNSFFAHGRIFSASMVKNSKPAPDLFLYAAKEMGASPKDCIVIEDSLYGIQAGVAAGMQSFGFVGGSHILDLQHKDLLIEAGASLIFDQMLDLIITIGDKSYEAA